MKRLVLALCLLTPTAVACDTSSLSLSGTVHLDTCSPDDGSSDCVFASRALYDYVEAIPDSDALYTIAIQSSPWRLYDGDMRILTIEVLADSMRPKLGRKVERVELIGSWTGVSPSPGVPSLAGRLSNALDGLPVKGEDGFLWLSADGTRRTTRQAFTMRQGAGSYFIPKRSEVLVALAGG